MGTVEEFKKEVEAEAEKPIEAPAVETLADPFDDAPDGDNRDYKLAAQLVNEIEAEQAKVDAINEEAKKKKEPHQTHMNVLKKRFKDETGIETPVLNLTVAERKQLRRMAERKNKLDEGQSNQFKQMQMSFA